MAEDDGPEQAVPGVYVPTADDRGRLVGTLQVDGETFTVRSRGGGFDYEWTSGPNEGYGFGSSGGTDDSLEAHEASIRAFLGMIDPATGYIAED